MIFQTLCLFLLTFRQASQKNCAIISSFHPDPTRVHEIFVLPICVDSYKNSHIWGFPKIGVPQNGWFIMENPIKLDDLGVPPFKETSIYPNPCIIISVIHIPSLHIQRKPFCRWSPKSGVGVVFSDDVPVGFRSKRSNSWPPTNGRKMKPNEDSYKFDLYILYIAKKKNTFIKSGLILTKHVQTKCGGTHLEHVIVSSSFSLESKRNMFVCIHICNRKQWKCCPLLYLHFQLGSDWELPVLRKHIHKKHVSRWQRSEFRQRTFVLSKKWRNC